MTVRHDILMPEIGAEGQPVRFVQWLADPGAEVVAGDRIAEVVTAGVLYYVQAPSSGMLVPAWQVDAVVHAGDALGAILSSDADD